MTSVVGLPEVEAQALDVMLRIADTDMGEVLNVVSAEDFSVPWAREVFSAVVAVGPGDWISVHRHLQLGGVHRATDDRQICDLMFLPLGLPWELPDYLALVAENGRRRRATEAVAWAHHLLTEGADVDAVLGRVLEVAK